MWAIDVPNPYDIDEAWLNIDYFEDEEAAIAFARKTFGADERGNINIVSFVGEEEEEEEEG